MAGHDFQKQMMPGPFLYVYNSPFFGLVHDMMSLFRVRKWELRSNHPLLEMH